MDVRTRLALGKTQRDKVQGYVTKNEDFKIAYLTLPKDVKFTYPDLYPSEAEAKKQKREDEKSLDQSKDAFKSFLDRNKKRPDLPGWYSL